MGAESPSSRHPASTGTASTSAWLVEERRIDVEQLEKGSIRALLLTPGQVRSTVARLDVVWLLYATAYVPTNLCISSWQTAARAADDPLTAYGGLVRR